MQKKHLVMIGLVAIVLLGGFYFWGQGEKSGWDAVQPDKKGGSSPVSKSPDNSPESPQVTAQVSYNGETKEINFELYKHRKPTTMMELDRVEQMAVSFVIDYFNAPAEETVHQLFTRICDKWNHPNLQDWEFEGYVEKERMFIGHEKFPVQGPRELLGVYLLPEYIEEKTVFVVPMQIIYNLDNEEVNDIIYLSIVRGGDGVETIAGHYDNRGPKVQEIIKKYELDKQAEQ